MLYFPKSYFNDPILCGQISVLITALQKTPPTMLCCLIIQAWHWLPCWRALSPRGCWMWPQSPAAAEGGETLSSSCPQVPHPQGILRHRILSRAQLPLGWLGINPTYDLGCPRHSLFLFNHCHKKGLSCWYHVVKFQKELNPISFLFPTAIHRCSSRSDNFPFLLIEIGATGYLLAFKWRAPPDTSSVTRLKALRTCWCHWKVKCFDPCFINPHTSFCLLHSPVGQPRHKILHW